MTATSPSLLASIEWSRLTNEQGGDVLWLGSWLVDADGLEGDWFYSGRGGEACEVRLPAEACGIRIRRWPSDGLTPEYVDLPLSMGPIRTADLNFDCRQPHTRLTLTRPDG